MTNIIIQGDEGFNDIVTRPYDFNRGDRRLPTFKRALWHAQAVAEDTGVRRVVRRDPTFDGCWLSQEIG